MNAYEIKKAKEVQTEQRIKNAETSVRVSENCITELAEMIAMLDGAVCELAEMVAMLMEGGVNNG